MPLAHLNFFEFFESRVWVYSAFLFFPWALSYCESGSQYPAFFICAQIVQGNA